MQEDVRPSRPSALTLSTGPTPPYDTSSPACTTFRLPRMGVLPRRGGSLFLLPRLCPPLRSHHRAGVKALGGRKGICRKTARTGKDRSGNRCKYPHKPPEKRKPAEDGEHGGDGTSGGGQTGGDQNNNSLPPSTKKPKRDTWSSGGGSSTSGGASCGAGAATKNDR